MEGIVLAVVGAVLAVALAGIGSAIGCGLAGQASSGVMSEDPEKFGKLLILVALPGTQGFYGFVISYLALMKLGLVGGKEAVEIAAGQGWLILLACLPVALAGLISAIHQGRVCAAGAQMTAKQPEEVGKAMILAVFVEIYAVLGFVISFLLLFGIKI